MEKKFKLGVIGAGFMASSIISGAIRAGCVSPDDVIVSDINQNSLDKISTFGVSTTFDSSEVCNNSEYVIIAVKPQNFNEVSEKIAKCFCNKYISIMAGVKIEKIKSLLGQVKVARCMPNTPCSVSSGAVGIDVSDFIDNKERQFIISLFSSFATVSVLPESLINAVTGISGSSPAYFYLFAKSVIEAGVNNGLPYEDAKNLAVNTMIGAGKMILANPDRSIDELISSVCSKGGTTIEAVKVFEQLQLTNITGKAVDACIKRASELENL